jgi:hypothetical protein
MVTVMGVQEQTSAAGNADEAQYAGLVATVGRALLIVGCVKENVTLLPKALVVSTDTSGCAPVIEDDISETPSAEEEVAVLRVICEELEGKQFEARELWDTEELAVYDEAVPGRPTEELCADDDELLSQKTDIVTVDTVVVCVLVSVVRVGVVATVLPIPFEET